MRKCTLLCITFLLLWTVPLFAQSAITTRSTNLRRDPSTQSAHIQNAHRALAIDERRKPFAPAIWERIQGFNGALELAWFPGVHSNVGGSTSRDGLANEALHWIVEKAEKLGLEFDNAFLQHYTPCFNSELQDSMTPMYKVLGPYVRPLGQHASDGEEVHQSALDRKGLATLRYAPQNLEAYLANPTLVKVCNTSRITRGTRCPDRHILEAETLTALDQSGQRSLLLTRLSAAGSVELAVLLDDTGSAGIRGLGEHSWFAQVIVTCRVEWGPASGSYHGGALCFGPELLC